MSLTRASKRREYTYNLLYERGMIISSIHSQNERLQKRAVLVQRQKEERAKKLIEMITCFNEKFAANEALLQTMAKLFEAWQKQQFYKEIPNALIQMENCMKNNGFEVEWSEWEETVQQNFKAKGSGKV